MALSKISLSGGACVVLFLPRRPVVTYSQLSTQVCLMIDYVLLRTRGFESLEWAGGNEGMSLAIRAVSIKKKKKNKLVWDEP